MSGDRAAAGPVKSIPKPAMDLNSYDMGSLEHKREITKPTDKF